MTRVANQFQDPAGTLPTYSWEINHDAEDEGGKSRNITVTANTGRTGLVRQEGDETPLTLSYSGTFFSKNQLVRMLRYWEACSTRTIRFVDFLGDTYGVLITDFRPLRKRVVRNPRDQANAPGVIWTYKIVMQVIDIISGPYDDADVTP